MLTEEFGVVLTEWSESQIRSWEAPLMPDWASCWSRDRLFFTNLLARGGARLTALGSGRAVDEMDVSEPFSREAMLKFEEETPRAAASCINSSSRFFSFCCT